MKFVLLLLLLLLLVVVVVVVVVLLLLVTYPETAHKPYLSKSCLTGSEDDRRKY